MHKHPDYSYSVTYGIVDPDNIDDNGDLIPEESEAGFVVDGRDYELPPGTCGDEAAEWMERNEVDSIVAPSDWFDEGGDDCPANEARCRSMAAFLISGGYVEPNCNNGAADSCSWPDGQTDLFTGRERRETCHLHGWPDSDRRMIARLVEAGDASAELS